MTKKVITQSEYYQLLGLKTLAVEYNKKLEDIIEAVSDVLEARGQDGTADGYVMDTIYSNSIPITGLLASLEITVEGQ